MQSENVSLFIFNLNHSRNHKTRRKTHMMMRWWESFATLNEIFSFLIHRCVDNFKLKNLRAIQAWIYMAANAAISHTSESPTLLKYFIHIKFHVWFFAGFFKQSLLLLLCGKFFLFGFLAHTSGRESLAWWCCVRVSTINYEQNLKRVAITVCELWLKNILITEEVKTFKRKKMNIICCVEARGKTVLIRYDL